MTKGYFVMKRRVVFVVVVAGIGLLGWGVYHKISGTGKDPEGRQGNAPVAVEVVPVKKAAIREVGSYTGTLYPLSSFIMAPKIAGRLEKILVHIGDEVKGGQLVAVLDDEEYRQQVSQARAELEVAEANLQERQNTLENAKREYERTVELRNKKIASESQLDASESQFKTHQAELRVATAQLSQKEAALRMAEVRLSYTQIKVPENHATADRVVGERYVDEGAMLAPNTPIVSVLAIENLIAAIYVIERDYPKLVPGLEAMISTDAFPGRTFTGKVIRIAPLLKEESREARVELEISNEEKLLKPGMFVRVRIQFDERENATVVPATSLVKRNGAQGVFLADLSEKKARFVPVTVGITGGGEVEVLDPPISGSIVALGQHLLEDGASIIVTEQTPAGSPPGQEARPALTEGQGAGGKEKP